MRKQDPGAIIEEVVHTAFERTEAFRAARGEKPRHIMEARENAKDGAPRNWWGPKRYRVTLWLRPWEFVKLTDTAYDGGYPSIHKYIQSIASDARLVPLLEAAGMKRKKKEADVVPLKPRKKTKATAAKALPPIVSAHYGLPAAPARRRALHA